MIHEKIAKKDSENAAQQAKKRKADSASLLAEQAAKYNMDIETYKAC